MNFSEGQCYHIKETISVENTQRTPIAAKQNEPCTGGIIVDPIKINPFVTPGPPTFLFRFGYAI